MKLRPTKVSWKDRRFAHAKLFGAARSFPDEFHIEHQYAIRNQNDENRPSGCTAYTVSTIAGYQDGIVYSVDYQLMKTFELMQVPPNTDGADLRQAFKVPTVWGLLEADNEPPMLLTATQAWAANQSNWSLTYDEQAAKNKNPAYIPVVPMFGQDWFDAVRSAILGGQEEGETRAVGVGTRWSSDFETRIIGGYLPVNPAKLYWGHAYLITGWKNDWIEILTWQGMGYGDGGYAYMHRDLFNRLMSEWGTYAATLRDVPTSSADEIKSQQITILEAISALTALLQNVYLKVRYGVVL